MTYHKMLVSIITPLYNAEKFIAKTIESVLSQTHTNWEMIIVDDCSTDNSVKIVKKYIQKDKRIKLIELEKQGGPALVRNKAIEESKGRYIAFLDSDDLWVDEKLEKQIDMMQSDNLAFTYAAYGLINEKGNNIGQFNVKKEISYDSLLKTCSIGCLTVMYDVDKVGKVYMLPSLNKGEDYTLWLKIMKQIKQTKGILEPLAYYRIHENSISRNKLHAAKVQWKIYRQIEKLSMTKSIYYFVHYTYFGMTKYRQ